MIAIDIGNSRIKWAHYKHGVRQLGGVCAYSVAEFEMCIGGLNIPLHYGGIFISLVAGDEIKNRLEHWLASQGCSEYEFVVVSAEMAGIKCAYKQPGKLGIDRWLAMIAGYHHESRAEGEGLCVLDCGTAITLDYVNAEGRHLGGWIMPGYQTMLHSLASSAAKLEIPERLPADISQLADNTADAITRGTASLLVHGLSTLLAEKSAQLGSRRCCIVTGGDAGWISENLQQSCIYEPELVLQGLERMSRQSLRIQHKK